MPQTSSAQPPSPQTLAALELVRAGVTVPVASRQTGVSRSTLYRQCHRSGIRVPRAEWKGASPHPNSMAAVEMVRAGATARQASERAGVNDWTVRLHCKRAGVAIPHPPPAPRKPRQPTRVARALRLLAKGYDADTVRRGIGVAP